MAGRGARREALARRLLTRFLSIQRPSLGSFSDRGQVWTLDIRQSPQNLLDLISLSQDLQELLGRKVDVVTDRGLSPYLRDNIIREARPL